MCFLKKKKKNQFKTCEVAMSDTNIKLTFLKNIQLLNILLMKNDPPT